jgi:MSHA biogenesis protein MshI
MLVHAKSALHAWLRRNGVRTAAPAARVGLQFSSQQLRLVRVSRTLQGRLLLERAEVLSCEPARRPDVLRRLANSGALRHAAVHVVLAAGEYDVHLIPAPAVPADELREAVRFALRDSLAYPPEEAMVDYVRVPLAPGAEAPARQTLLTVAARLRLVDDLALLFADAGIELDSIDAPEFAQRNLALLNPISEGSLAGLSFDSDTALLTVQWDDELAFARRAQLPVARAQADVIEFHTAPDAQTIAERIANHVQRSLELYERQSGLPPVLQMLVAPHPLAAASIAAITERTGIEARVFDPTAQLDLAPGAVGLNGARADSSERWSDLIAALGTALRGPAQAAAATARPTRWFAAVPAAA